ncbi:MAG: hypothetical protein O9325_00820 [Roseomonas sp.]|nr:hypothetical protein [Roseomonas sp.]
MLAQTGATPDLVACLVSEATKKQPANRIVEACCFLLEGALNDLRIAGNGGDTAARARLVETYHAVERAATVNRLAPGVLLLIARAFAQAGLEPGPALKDATLAAMEAGFSDDPTPPKPDDVAGGDLGGSFAPLAKALGQDPFAVHAELAATSAAFPSEHRAAMAAELATSTIPALRDAALGFLLDADPAPGLAVLEVLVAQARGHPVPSRLVERLINLRPWLPSARQAKLDAAIRALRANAAAPVPAPRSEVTRLLASLCDGAGAQSLFALLKTGRRFALASVLIKADVGVADAWVREDMPKREADGIIAQITGATEAVTVPVSFVEARLADALAINLARQTPPPFGLLQVTEALGLGLLQPAEIAPMALAAQLLAGLPPDQTGAEATRAAHADAADWPELFETVGSWFEAGEAVEALLRPIPSRRKRIEAMLTRHLPGRRHFWAERCAWMAATLRNSATDDSEEWLNFALVARDLASGEPMSDAALFDAIAEMTVDVFAASASRRRQAGRRGR